MPRPRDIFDDPDRYVELLTGQNDSEVEKQFLDRKQAPPAAVNGAVLDRDLDKLVTQVIETVSAFANGNREAGLLVIGISKSGQILGIDHLSEKQGHD